MHGAWCMEDVWNVSNDFPYAGGDGYSPTCWHVLADEDAIDYQWRRIIRELVIGMFEICSDGWSTEE